MRTSEKVKSWIEWSRANLPSSGDIPKINSTELRPPWLEDTLETVQMMAYERDELLPCFVGQLEANPPMSLLGSRPFTFTAHSESSRQLRNALEGIALLQSGKMQPRRRGSASSNRKERPVS